MEIPYLYIVKIEVLTPSPVYLYSRISLFQCEKGNLVVKIDNFTPSPFYLYNVKIGNFPEI